MSVTIKDLVDAKKNGISENTFRARIQRGWDKERAVTEPVVKERGKWLKVALERGISERTFDTRVYTLGMPFEKAALKPLRKYDQEKKGETS